MTSKHGSVDDQEDAKIVMRVLLQNDVPTMVKGRSTGGSAHNSVEVQPALDLFTLGERVITRSSFLDDLMSERMGGAGSVDSESECSEDQELREEEEQWEQEEAMESASGGVHNSEGGPDEERDDSDEELDVIDYGDTRYSVRGQHRLQRRHSAMEEDDFELGEEEETDGDNSWGSGSESDEVRM